MRTQLPRFGLDAYTGLLNDLRSAGYRFAPVVALSQAPAERTVLIRHDVDLDPPSTVAMAEREAELGIVATYYVPLTQHFNVLEPVHREAVRRLRDLGHEIGLHYDLRTYPADPDAARAHLDVELGVLAHAAEAPIRTLVMHQPHRGHPDVFRSGSGLVHPHDPALADGLVYVSDSCRAWRDDTLLDAFGDDPPVRLLLNVHPELWLDDTVDRPLDYLEQTLLPIALGRAETFMRDEAAAWQGHDTARIRV